MATPPNTLPVATKLKQFKQELALRQDMLRPMLPAHVSMDKFMVAVSTAVANNPDLLDCYRPSLLKACVESAELGLSLNPVLREADILTNWNSRANRKDASFRPRYTGYVKLARQSGEVKDVYAHVVREGDRFDYELGLEKKLSHKPAASDKRGAITHAYCVWVLNSGVTQFEVMDRAQIDSIKARSTSKNKAGELVGPWVSDEEEMTRKTVMRRAAKFMPLSTVDRMRSAVELDTVREFDARPATIDHETGEVVYEDHDEDGVVLEPEVEQKPVERKASPAARKLDSLTETKPAPGAAYDLADEIPDFSSRGNAR